ncbi:MAG: penicillin-binding transpeptidase domain-containing protein, partial [Planctomycetota bacterium]
LQRAAQRTLERPILPGSDPKRDEVWFENPVGAICLVSTRGDILAAASVPTREELPPPGRDGERGNVVERTLRRHTFEPPGSVLKPFVALYALENLGWDPSETTDCARISSRGAGWESLHCHSTAGHGPLALHEALMCSCNAYFARIGENYSVDQLEEMLSVFGFGRPTGVRSLGKRSGLREDFQSPGTIKLIEAQPGEPRNRLMRQAANGLSLIEATPLQVARATTGLLTGELPELRLIDRIDGEPLPRRVEPLPFSPENLMRVQDAMFDVVNEVGGSAHNKGMNKNDLGFQVAAKTGSADYRSFEPGFGPTLSGGRKSSKVRKHTWIAGWFPAEDPVAVLVVYLHDVTETSSHTSVHVAAQFLRSPEVQTFVSEWKRRP